MEIVWDRLKRRTNVEKHGLDFADLDLDFVAAATILPTHSRRPRAIGRLDGLLVVTVVFQPLGRQALSIVSLRAASKKQRRRHEQGV